MIELKNVSLYYPINASFKSGDGAHSSIGGKILKLRDKQHVLALDNISLNIANGEITGLVGVNGSGKSTLLRVIAGILYPTKGFRRVEGKVTTLFSRNIGLDRNASAIDNIRLAAALYNIPSRMVPDIIDDIADFTELGDFMYLPVSSYSAGMSARLGFAIATTQQAEIVLIDEVIGAGDSLFQDKARKRLENVVEKAGTILIASHRRDLLHELCDNVIWLNRGKLERIGPAEDVINDFRRFIKAKRLAAGVVAADDEVGGADAD